MTALDQRKFSTISYSSAKQSISEGLPFTEVEWDEVYECNGTNLTVMHRSEPYQESLLPLTT